MTLASRVALVLACTAASLAAAPAAGAQDVSREELRELARQAASDPAALKELRRVDAVDRDPVDLDEVAGWDVSGVTGEELAAVRRFLERRGELEHAARHDLARDLADRLRPKVAGAPGDLSAERFLERLATAKAARS